MEVSTFDFFTSTFSKKWAKSVRLLIRVNKSASISPIAFQSEFTYPFLIWLATRAMTTVSHWAWSRSRRGASSIALLIASSMGLWRIASSCIPSWILSVNHVAIMTFFAALWLLKVWTDGFLLSMRPMVATSHASWRLVLVLLGLTTPRLVSVLRLIILLHFYNY